MNAKMLFFGAKNWQLNKRVTMTKPGMTYPIRKTPICPLLLPIYIFVGLGVNMASRRVEYFSVLFSSHSPPGLHVDDNINMQLNGGEWDVLACRTYNGKIKYIQKFNKETCMQGVDV
jgi:hypothetical protein